MTKTIALIKSRTSTLMAALFIAANIGLPHLFHLIPGGGVMFLPIYFFTAFAAVSYGKWTGIVTGIMSPLTGYLIFGAPKAYMIPDMMLKAVMLSAAIAYFMTKARRTAELIAAIPVAVIVAWGLTGVMELTFTSYEMAFQDFHTGIPGMVLMTIAGWIALIFKLKVEN